MKYSDQFGTTYKLDQKAVGAIFLVTEHWHIMESSVSEVVWPFVLAGDVNHGLGHPRQHPSP